MVRCGIRDGSGRAKRASTATPGLRGQGVDTLPRHAPPCWAGNPACCDSRQAAASSPAFSRAPAPPPSRVCQSRRRKGRPADPTPLRDSSHLAPHFSLHGKTRRALYILLMTVRCPATSQRAGDSASWGGANRGRASSGGRAVLRRHPAAGQSSRLWPPAVPGQCLGSGHLPRQRVTANRRGGRRRGRDGLGHPCHGQRSD